RSRPPGRREGAALGVPGRHPPRAALTPERMLLPTWIGEEENGEKRKGEEAARPRLAVAAGCAGARREAR
ncbi:unnamed protein product, partial [Rangifer tarandus platyrhynchus]